jgi:hypothetical protein
LALPAFYFSLMNANLQEDFTRLSFFELIDKYCSAKTGAYCLLDEIASADMIRTLYQLELRIQQHSADRMIHHTIYGES